MKAIDRVMRAYCSTRVLTDEQQVYIRAELSKFIQQLVAGKPAALELGDKDASS